MSNAKTTTPVLAGVGVCFSFLAAKVERECYFARPDHSGDPSGRQLSRSDFALGNTVSFEGRDFIEHLGTIVRLNQKTATVSCDDHEWRVPFSLLRHVVDL